MSKVYPRFVSAKIQFNGASCIEVKHDTSADADALNEQTKFLLFTYESCHAGQSLIGCWYPQWSLRKSTASTLLQRINRWIFTFRKWDSDVQIYCQNHVSRVVYSLVNRWITIFRISDSDSHRQNDGFPVGILINVSHPFPTFGISSASKLRKRSSGERPAMRDIPSWDM